MNAALQQQAESFLGADILPSEWDEARVKAQQKLDRIVSQEGDGNGARREPEYLAQLIAEAVRNLRMADFSLQLIALDTYIKNRGK